MPSCLSNFKNYHVQLTLKIESAKWRKLEVASALRFKRLFQHVKPSVNCLEEFRFKQIFLEILTQLCNTVTVLQFCALPDFFVKIFNHLHIFMKEPFKTFSKLFKRINWVSWIPLTLWVQWIAFKWKTAFQVKSGNLQ